MVTGKYIPGAIIAFLGFYTGYMMKLRLKKKIKKSKKEIETQWKNIWENRNKINKSKLAYTR